MNRFLLTGLPRIRSAWFAALFQAVGVETCHDSQVRFGSVTALSRWLGEPGVKGWCDPSAACLMPTFAADLFQGRPVVIIERDAADSRASLERWVGCELPRFTEVAANVLLFKQKVGADYVFTVPYENLDRYETVSQIVQHCAGIHVPYKTWRTFDLLKIEQHVDKARALYAAAA